MKKKQRNKERKKEIKKESQHRTKERKRHRSSWVSFALEKPVKAYLAERAVVNLGIHEENIYNGSYRFF
jgi:hypothetical protein